jgi:hypothetical protein
MPVNVDPEAGPAGHGLRVYPIPTSGTLRVTGAGPARIRIFDISGREVSIVPEYREGSSLDLSSLESGIYFLQAEEAIIRFFKE